jgi:hypothetical protein
MLGSIVRGSLVSAAVTAALVLPRSVDLATTAWVLLLAVSHLLLPVAAAYWGRRPDSASLDVGLAGIGVVYLVLLSLLPHGGSSTLIFLGVPVGFALYAALATVAFNALARWRRLARVRSIKRRRERGPARPAPALR